MKPDIHPTYVETQVTCTCGNTFTTQSTAPTASCAPTSAPPATRSTRASRRSSTPVAAWPASRSGTPQGGLVLHQRREAGFVPGSRRFGVKARDRGAR